MPQKLISISWTSLLLGALCALIIAADSLVSGRQKTWIMYIVWPVTALYAGPLGILAYYTAGRRPRRKEKLQPGDSARQRSRAEKPFWKMVGVGATHCGAGCTLGDLCAEWIVFAFPLVIFGHRLFGSWAVDYLFAFLFGISFQFFTIVPMRNLSVASGLWAAIKADFLSLTAWQVGMYGWMAVVTFLIFGRELEKNNPVFWFMMQIAMLAGFMTSYPVNWLLLRNGVKEKMSS